MNSGIVAVFKDHVKHCFIWFSWKAGSIYHLGQTNLKIYIL